MEGTLNKGKRAFNLKAKDKYRSPNRRKEHSQPLLRTSAGGHLFKECKKRKEEIHTLWER